MLRKRVYLDAFASLPNRVRGCKGQSLTLPRFSLCCLLLPISLYREKAADFATCLYVTANAISKPYRFHT